MATFDIMDAADNALANIPHAGMRLPILRHRLLKAVGLA